MRQTSRWALPFLFIALFPATAGAADGPTEAELRTLFDQLVASVGAGDDAGVDAATCLNDLVHAQLEREHALGLVADAGDPALVDERKSAARAAAYAFVERLLAKGQVEYTDASRVELFADKSGERMRRDGQEDLEITAAGVLGVKMLTADREVDVDVCRLGDRWCLNALSMQ